MNDAIKLNTIFTNLSKKKKPKLLGRGIGCGKGKTSGRGHKGQKARSGVSINGFEGGQQSIYTRLPKRGFKPIRRNIYSIINVGDVQRLIKAGKIAKNSVIDKEMLYKLGFIKSIKDKIKLLNKCELEGKLSDKFIFRVDFASEAAKKSVALSGGSVEVLLHRDIYAPIKIGDVQRLVDAGKIKKGSVIDKELLHKLGFIESVKDKIKLINKGKLSDKFIFRVDFASEAAKESVASLGGSVEILS